MTAHRHRRPGRARRPWGELPFVAQLHRSRADVGPLVVTAVALALTVLLADVSPRAMNQVADRAVRAAVADRPVSLVVSAPITNGDMILNREANTAERVAAVAQEIDAALPADLASVLDAPIGTVQTTEVDVVVPGGDGPASMRMAYVWRDGASGVDWLEGSAPQASAGGDVMGGGPWTWPVEIGLAEPVATALNARAGDRLTVTGPDRSALDVTVSGVFRAQDEDDPIWDAVPGMLEPDVRGRGAGLTTTVAGYLSAESLPDARMALAFTPTAVRRSFDFPADADRVTFAGLEAVAGAASGLEAAPQALDLVGPRPTLTTDLDTVLRTAGDRVRAAGVQASVLLVGLLAACVMVLGLGAWLLARRRTTVLRAGRSRGATLPGVVAGPLVEHAILAGIAGAVGLGVSQLLVPGPPSWAWVVPVLAVVVLGTPLLSVVLVTQGDIRRVVLDRHRRRRSAWVRRIRRAVAEGALVLAAAAAVLTLRSRGLPDAGTPDLLPTAAPTLVVVAAGVVGARLARGLERGVRPVTARLRSLTPLLAAAHGAAGGGATVPFVALTMCVGLAGFGAVVAATLQGGQLEGSWDTVRADVLVRTSGTAPLDEVAERLAGAPGVEAVAVGRFERTVQILGVPTTGRVDVLAVDADQLARLWAASPRPAPALAALTESTGSGAALPALVSPGLAAQLTAGDAIVWGEARVEIAPVGTAPALPTAMLVEDRAEDDVVVVDRAALAAAAGTDVVAEVLWALGPRAEQAVAAETDLAGAEVTGRGAWLAERRGESLTAGLLLLLQVAWPVLTGLAAVVVLLSAVATAPARTRSLAVLRVVGMDDRGVRRIMLGELLPWVLAATACGVLVGGGLAAVLVGPLQLRLVTGQTADPLISWPWWFLAVLPLMGLVVAVLVRVEQSARRRERLGLVMRVGG